MDTNKRGGNNCNYIDTTRVFPLFFQYTYSQPKHVICRSQCIRLRQRRRLSHIPGALYLWTEKKISTCRAGLGFRFSGCLLFGRASRWDERSWYDHWVSVFTRLAPEIKRAEGKGPSGGRAAFGKTFRFRVTILRHRRAQSQPPQ